MPKLIFFNLAIDQLWENTGVLKKLFGVRIPESEHLVRVNEDLGIFFSEAEDLVLTYNFDPAFKQFLSQWMPSLGEVQNIKTNPFDEDLWLQEVSSIVGSLGKRELLACGVSRLEERLLAQAPLLTPHPSLGAHNFVSQFNKKTNIIKFSEYSGLSIPATKIVTQEQLLSEGIPLPFPVMLKANWGSGGGGNLKIKSNEEPIWRHFQRLPASETQWVVQEMCSREADFSVFSDGTEDVPPIFKVDYDQHNLSFRHSAVQGNAKVAASLLEGFEGLRARFLKKGYDGPLGIDAILTQGEVKLVDVNVRWTKTHAIERAMRLFKLNPGEVESVRLRFRAPGLSFSDWWPSCQRALGLTPEGRTKENLICLPYSVSGLRAQAGPQEVSCFISRDPGWWEHVQAKFTGKRQ